jgi:hypothetical protein
VRILAAVAHYFDVDGIRRGDFGSYQRENFISRSVIVDRTITLLNESLAEFSMNFNIQVFGIENQYTRRPDVILDVADPRHIPYATIDAMYKKINQYDYFLFVEDDIELSPKTIIELMEINQHLDLHETIIPNRLEYLNGTAFCVDMIAMPGFKNGVKIVERHILAQSINPHSGFMFLSRDKFARAYALKVNSQPKIIIGDFMASALANIHSSLDVYRSIPTASSLSVVHQDSWSARMESIGHLKENSLSRLIDESRETEREILSGL